MGSEMCIRDSSSSGWARSSAAPACAWARLGFSQRACALAPLRLRGLMHGQLLHGKPSSLGCADGRGGVGRRLGTAPLWVCAERCFGDGKARRILAPLPAFCLPLKLLPFRLATVHPAHPPRARIASATVIACSQKSTRVSSGHLKSTCARRGPSLRPACLASHPGKNNDSNGPFSHGRKT